MSADKRTTDWAIFRRLLKLAKPYWPPVLGIFLIGLISTPLTLLNPLPLKIAVDNVLGSKPLPGFLKALIPEAATGSDGVLLLLIAIFIVTIAALSQLQDLGDSMLRTYIGEKLVLEYRARLFNHAQRLSLSYHDKKGTADTSYRIQYDTMSVRYIAVDGVIPFITSTFTLISMLYVTYRIDGQLALVAMAVTPILFIVARLYRKQLRRKARLTKEKESAAFAVIQEVLTSLRVVKAFGQEEREQERLMQRSGETVTARMRQTLAEGGIGLLLGVTLALGTAIVLFIGVRHVQASIITLGDLLLVMGYLSKLYAPLNTISSKVTSLQSHLVSAERAFSLLDMPQDVPELPEARSIERARGEVAFHNVCFCYDEHLPILEEISFHVPAGSRVGIAGKTGVGKTTLIGLLTRFYDPTQGEILLDGARLCDYKLADLRDQFAIVLQEAVLFSTTIAENIAYARPQASMDEIITAANAANAHDFVLSLPEEYQTQVGERGMRLSGGERQRIALARAFLKDAPILILDEPTSSVDMRTESDILDAMERLMVGRTTFIIAHRLTTLKNCDLLLTLKDGRLAAVQTNVRAVVENALELGGLEETLALDKTKSSKKRLLTRNKVAE